jgi:hypothetical protein
MTTKPIDPYNLVGDRFPAEEPVAYLREAIESLKDADVHTEASGLVANEAGRHEDGLANEMYGSALALTVESDNAQSISVLLATMAIMITETQQVMTRLCYEGTLAVAGGDAATSHRMKIAGVKQAYDRSTAEIGRGLQLLAVNPSEMKEPST